eukprot:sb/3473698/
MIQSLLKAVFSPIFLTAFTMTFLAEWGDRSQITTIILSSREDPWGVCFGGILGHSLCTAMAVIGGRMIAQKISVRTDLWLCTCIQINSMYRETGRGSDHSFYPILYLTINPNPHFHYFSDVDRRVCFPSFCHFINLLWSCGGGIKPE